MSALLSIALATALEPTVPLWLGATVDVSPADAPIPTAIVDLTTVELP